MTEKSTAGGAFPDDRRDAEAALGGADAVPKTTYVTGSGTEPEATKPPGTPAATAAAGGQGATWAIIAFLVVGAVIVYLLGFGR
jgi:hypothetical protein